MIRNVVNIVMGMMYAFIGGFIMYRDWFFMDLAPWAAIALGVLFIAYGGFRVYRAIQLMRN
ncbi:MAG TPA: hypothetical protein VL022_05875 [Moheibacter sp.]|nr:hypothetical protein [Moheibacter sp.]